MRSQQTQRAAAAAQDRKKQRQSSSRSTRSEKTETEQQPWPFKKKAGASISSHKHHQKSPFRDLVEARSLMVGTSGGHDFFGTESGSDDETFDNFGEHEAKEDELLHGCDSYGASDENLIFIKPSPSRVHEDKFEPFIGMIFPSLDAARDFYYEYAKHTGFTIRTNRIRHSQKNMAIIGRDFVCSREGFRAAKHALKKDRVLPPRPITREGCKAMIRLAAKDVGSWIVTKFVRDHSHKLMTKCNFAGELPTVNILSEEEKDKKILELNNELQHERERSSTFREQLHMILKDLEEHAEFMSIRVEDIVNTLKGIELDND